MATPDSGGCAGPHGAAGQAEQGQDSRVVSQQRGGPQTDHSRAATRHQGLSIIHCFPLGAGVKCLRPHQASTALLAPELFRSPRRLVPGSGQPPSRVLDRQRGWPKILWTQHHVLTGKPKALEKRTSFKVGGADLGSPGLGEGSASMLPSASRISPFLCGGWWWDQAHRF